MGEYPMVIESSDEDEISIFGGTGDTEGRNALVSGTIPQGSEINGSGSQDGADNGSGYSGLSESLWAVRSCSEASCW